MKAVLKERPGFGLSVKDIPVPEIKDDEVLIEVKAAGICGSDIHVYEWTGSYEWMERVMPVVMGHEFSGKIAAAGKGVSGLSEGDRVIARPVTPCGSCHYCRSEKSSLCTRPGGGIGLLKDGAFAGFVAVPASSCIKMPDQLSFEAGALLEPLVIGANAAYRAGITLGDTVVVLGPGPIGLFAMIFAKAAGATRAVMVGTAEDEKRLQAAKKFGADYLVVAGEEDPVKMVREITGGVGADVVFEATGVPLTVRQGLDMLQKDRPLVSIGIFPAPVEVEFTPMVRNSRSIVGSYAGPLHFWDRVISWILSGPVDITGVITERASVDDAVEVFEKCRARQTVKAMFIF